MDKTVGRIVYRSKGDVSSKNYLSITNLDLAGPIFVFQLSLIEPLISTIHIEVMTSLQLPLRITLSTLYGKDPPTFLGRSMRYDTIASIQLICLIALIFIKLIIC